MNPADRPVVGLVVLLVVFMLLIVAIVYLTREDPNHAPSPRRPDPQLARPQPPHPRVVNVTITGVTDPETVGRQVTEMLRRHDHR